MKNLLVGASLAGALVVIALMAMTAGQNAQAAYLTLDGAAGSIASVDADMDTTTNGPTVVGAGGIQTSFGGIALGASHDFDVVVDEINVADGLSGFGLDILYDPAVICITAKSFAFNLPSGVDFESESLACPGDGDWRIDVGSIPPPAGVAGEVILVRVTAKCIGVVPGTSIIDVNDVLGGDGKPDVFAFTPGTPPTPFPSGPEGDGSIGCGQTAAQVPGKSVV